VSADTDILAMADARMASIAAIMGGRWSATRVAARIEALREPAEAAPPPALCVKCNVSPEKLRYCRWFLAADWPLGVVAFLFDLDPEHLSGALG
jgi:hypothetical protein